MHTGNGKAGHVVLAESLDTTILDQTAHMLRDGSVVAGLDQLFQSLQAQRLATGDTEWAKFVNRCLQHPLRELVHQDPFTYRAFSKPRGYAGDAEMMDFIYGREEGWPAPTGTSPLGKQIFDYTTGSSASEAVRVRRGFIADFIDRLVDDVRRPHLLSLAAGHLREAGLAAAVRRRRLGRFLALDADRATLNEVDRCYGPYGVETIHAPIRQLLSRHLSLGQFDLAYSTGLFDYLHLPAARRLAHAMFQMLRSGGRLLVANFLPGIQAVGYMESYMDWRLVYRTRREMLDVADDIPQAHIRDIRLFAEENENIIFLQVTRK